MISLVKKFKKGQKLIIDTVLKPLSDPEEILVYPNLPNIFGQP